MSFREGRPRPWHEKAAPRGSEPPAARLGREGSGACRGGGIVALLRLFLADLASRAPLRWAAERQQRHARGGERRAEDVESAGTAVASADGRLDDERREESAETEAEVHRLKSSRSWRAVDGTRLLIANRCIVLVSILSHRIRCRALLHLRKRIPAIPSVHLSLSHQFDYSYCPFSREVSTLTVPSKNH
eukprot:4403908-Pleurochrysis_carterae.AAC.4